MKKVLLTLLLACTVVFAGNAQSRALGVRLGYDNELSYQTYSGRSNMWDFTLGAQGFGSSSEYSYANFTAMYDWVWNIDGGLNWYLGPGVGVGLGFGAASGDYAVNVGGQIGLEYQFPIPLNISLDYRPMANVLGFGDGHGLNWYGLCLGIRYRF